MLLIAQLLIGYFVDHLYFRTHMKSSTAKQGRRQISVDSKAVDGWVGVSLLMSWVHFAVSYIILKMQNCKRTSNVLQMHGKAPNS